MTDAIFTRLSQHWAADYKKANKISLEFFFGFFFFEGECSTSIDVLPTSASDVLRQHKIRGITFGVTLLQAWQADFTNCWKYIACDGDYVKK